MFRDVAEEGPPPLGCSLVGAGGWQNTLEELAVCCSGLKELEPGPGLLFLTASRVSNEAASDSWRAHHLLSLCYVPYNVLCTLLNCSLSSLL